MGSGRSGLYHGATPEKYYPGSIDYMTPGDQFSEGIKNRKDIDANGYLDIIGHGDPKIIKVQHNGKQVPIDHRTFARLLKSDPQIAGKKIRLLSCNTGKIQHGFAQGLADKLGVEILAPSDYVWTTPKGHYFVAAGRWNSSTHKLEPIMSQPGKFIPFYPQRRNKK